jgi:hypothetical protein
MEQHAEDEHEDEPSQNGGTAWPSAAKARAA